MTQPVVIKFLDPHEGNAVAIVRSAPRVVGITLSIEKNGDTEVFMPLGDAEKFSQALLEAIESARNVIDVE